MSCVTAIGRRRQTGKQNRRVHDRHDDDVHPPVTHVRFFGTGCPQLIELTANDNIIARHTAVVLEGRFHETSSHFLRHQ